ncbi:MAG: NAD(P)H-dependent oxidoreductase [Candidatus Pacebacteria bacterium]|nr:NAD(P)H-dependent oxidoreductase [Candidatus Paceibacterota bacterium]
MSIVHKLEWRYATKHFDSEKLISEGNITEILKATNMSASALGLQPYEFIVIHNKDLQKKLAEHSFQGIEVENASHLIVFASKTTVNREYIKGYIDRTEKLRGLEKSSMKNIEDLTLSLVGAKSSKEIYHWTQRQAYVAIGTTMLAAADLKIDMCPMEVFDSEKYNEILGLTEQNLHASVVAVLGYRTEGDKDQFLKKTRRDLDDIVQLRY